MSSNLLPFKNLPLKSGFFGQKVFSNKYLNKFNIPVIMNITVERPPWKIDDFTIDDVVGKGDDKLHVILLNAYKTDTINYIERLEGYGLPKPERVPDYISTVLFHNNPDVNFSIGGDFKLINFANIFTQFQHYRRARMDFHERSNSHYATINISENSYHDNRFPEYVMPGKASMPFPRTIANQNVLNGFKLMNKGLQEIDAAETTEAEKEGRKKLVAGSHVLRYNFYELFTEDDYSMFSKLRARDVFPEHAKLPIYDFYDSELKYLPRGGLPGIIRKIRDIL